ncbi:MAG: hypothetical protein WC022_04210 [Parcubacteria group bacterium]
MKTQKQKRGNWQEDKEKQKKTWIMIGLGFLIIGCLIYVGHLTGRQLPHFNLWIP